jgi:hypothetical protein
LAYLLSSIPTATALQEVEFPSFGLIVRLLIRRDFIAIRLFVELSFVVAFGCSIVGHKARVKSVKRVKRVKRAKVTQVQGVKERVRHVASL